MNLQSRKSRRRLRSPFFIVAALLVAIVGALVWAWLHFGVQIHKLASGSMEPTLPEGVLVITTRSDDLVPGDIITFRHHTSAGEVTTHRFISTNPDNSLRTQGDANPSPDNFDQPIGRSDVVGKLQWHVDIMTAQFWQTGRGIILMICLPLLVLGLWLVLGGPSREMKEGGTIPV